MKLFSFLKKKKRVGLVLGGGAARGIAHIGVIKVLLAAGVTIHVIVGTSSGSIFGALLAGGMGIDSIEKATRRAGWNRLIRIALARRGAVSGESIERLIEDAIGARQFNQLKIPFAAVATDLSTGRLVAIRRGSVARAVHASSAIPGVFVPVRVGGRLLCDGMVTENVPIEVALSAGADVVIASDVVPNCILNKDPENMVEVLERALDIGVKRHSLGSKPLADFYIEPVAKNISPFALNHADELIEMGVAATERILPRIKRKLRLT